MDVVAVQLTSPAPGAIAVILLAGPDVRQLLQAVSRPTRAGAPAPGQVARTEILSDAGAAIDDALLVGIAP